LQPARRFLVNAGDGRYPLSPQVEAISVKALADTLTRL
jgi:hypothetical protein